MSKFKNIDDMRIRTQKILFYSSSISSLVISLILNGRNIILNLDYKGISLILVVLSLISTFSFLILSFNKRFFSNISLIGIITSTNIFSITLYLAIIHFLYPQRTIAKLMYLLCYIGIEVILFIRRIVFKNQLFLKCLYENRTNKFAKQDIILSLILAVTVISITKILDAKPQSIPTSYYDDIYHTIYIIPICIIAITFHIHTLAKFIFVERKKSLSEIKSTRKVISK